MARGMGTPLATLVGGLACLAAAACGSAAAHPDLHGGGRIHVAAVQLTPVGDDLAGNMANMERLVREAAARGARYVVLPEYLWGQLANRAGMTLDAVRAGAEPVDGPITRRFVRLAHELGVFIAFPLAERRTDGRVYNSTVYAGPGGVEGIYSKRALITLFPGDHDGGASEGAPHPWQEQDIYAPGTDDGIVAWGGVRVGALICADGGFPPLYDARIRSGIQLIAHASASGGIKTGDHNPMPDVAARRYHRPVVFANVWLPKPLFRGNSQICDANGNVLARAGAEPNVVVDAVVDVPAVDIR